ncbi:MAG: hypothetical protein AAF850_05235 [Pseudomonadota bacterium]
MSHSIRSLFLCVPIMFTLVSGSVAFAQDDEEERRPRQSSTLDPAVGRVLAPIFENEIANELWPACIAKLRGLLNERGDRLKPYDTAIVNQLLGQCQAGAEDYRGALRSFQRSVDSNGLPPDQVNGVRYVIAQLYFQLTDYNGAINSLNQWIRGGGQPDANAYYLLAAAYTQKQPADYRAALRPGEQAIALREEPKKGDHDLLNLIYSELNERRKRTTLLEKMVNTWPNEASYWRQLSGLYSQLDRSKDAFAVLEVAYRAGLIDKESEVLTLVQYYSFFDNPFRGAELLSREIESGTVKRTTKNLRLLSQLWSQSREHKRAIPILEEAARRADNGELFYRLGQTLLADEQYRKAEQALVQAIRKGGLTQRQTGDSWMLIGTARFSLAGPDDCDQRARSRTAFVNATRYSTSASQARSWVEYIDAIDSTVEQQDRLANQQANEERQASIERVRQQLQVCRLQSAEQSDCNELDERLQSLILQNEAALKSPPQFGCNKPDSPQTESVDGEETGATVSTDAVADEGEGGVAVKPEGADAEATEAADGQ